MKLQSLVDHIVKDVDESVFDQSVVDFVELEGECGKTFRDFGDEGMGSLLIFFVGGDELVVQSE